MSSINLFGLASQHNNWLSTRQELLAGNIANANTPRLQGASTCSRSRRRWNRPSCRWRSANRGTWRRTLRPPRRRPRPTAEKGWEVYHSGSNVSLEQELIKANDVNRAYTLNTNVVKAFHRMLLSSAKVGN